MNLTQVFIILFVCFLFNVYVLSTAPSREEEEEMKRRRRGNFFQLVTPPGAQKQLSLSSAKFYQLVASPAALQQQQQQQQATVPPRASRALMTKKENLQGLPRQRGGNIFLIDGDQSLHLLNSQYQGISGPSVVGQDVVGQNSPQESLTPKTESLQQQQQQQSSRGLRTTATGGAATKDNADESSRGGVVDQRQQRRRQAVKTSLVNNKQQKDMKLSMPSGLSTTDGSTFWWWLLPTLALITVGIMSLARRNDYPFSQNFWGESVPLLGFGRRRAGNNSFDKFDL